MTKHHKYVSYQSASDDSELFQKFCQDVQPLKQDKKLHPSKKRKSSIPPFQPRQEFKNLGNDQVYDTTYLNYVTPESELHYSKPGLRLQTLRQLKRGTLKIEARLDLHQHTINEALTKTEAFLHHKRCVLIIHGKGNLSKGKPVLKSVLNQWLRKQKNVLAFHSAQPKHGGTGALYVLLKKE